MGCITSKQGVPVIPAVDHSGGIRDLSAAGASDFWTATSLDNLKKKKKKRTTKRKKSLGSDAGGSAESRKTSFSAASTVSFRLSNLHKYLEGELVAAGWPAWLSAVAGKSIHGLLPLKAESFEKLEKIGQGTYSSVFRARELDTGKIVALKKVRFDNYDPESVRFMAREIQILRRLDHPNIMKLEGLITSRFSCSIYLVFDYMDHDLAGLSSCPGIQLSESQVKCYMHQLLCGLEHCHSRGVMHRDIKCANLLVNNKGILKIADFGLANYFKSGKKQPLTSRVVTLWYRPPELLLGSTDYGPSVDMWSVGCVLAELLLGKPILQGRTEVEQLHKIFKLCGSPPDEYWRRSKLPHATIFKPHQAYQGCLKDACKSLPASAFGLLENLLSVEPYKRGTAASALQSQYFTTTPYACEPSSLPVYAPNKEMDAKIRYQSRRKRISNGLHGSEGVRRAPGTYKPSQESNAHSKISSYAEEPKSNAEIRNNSFKLRSQGGNSRLLVDLQTVSSVKPGDESGHVKHKPPGTILFSGPLQVSSSSGFAWAKGFKDGKACKSISRCPNSDSLSGPTSGLPGDVVDSRCNNSKEMVKKAVMEQLRNSECPESFNAAHMFHSQELSEAAHLKDQVSSRRNYMHHHRDQGDRVEFSGPLLSHSHKVDELLEKHERHIRQAVRRSWFRRGKEE